MRTGLAGIPVAVCTAVFVNTVAAQDRSFISADEFVDLFTQGQTLCYAPDKAGNCRWAEYYPQVVGDRITVLSFQSFVEDAETSQPTFGVTVTQADYILDGQYICDPLDRSDNFSGFYYLDQDLRVVRNSRQFRPVNPETERRWLQNRSETDYCFAFYITEQDSAGRVTELVQHYFIDGIRRDDTDNIIVFEAGDRDVRLLPPENVLIGQPT